MDQLKLNIWHFIVKVFCYGTGIRYILDKIVNPWKRYKRLVDIPTEYMRQIIEDENIKVLVLDMDGTLKHYKKGLLAENKEWVNEIRKYVRIYISSNANKKYTSIVADELKLPYIYKARKPSSKSFKIICEKEKCSSDEMILIGDSIKGDLIGSKKFGIKKIILLSDLSFVKNK